MGYVAIRFASRRDPTANGFNDTAPDRFGEAAEVLLVLEQNGWRPLQGEARDVPRLFQTLESVFEPAAGLGGLKIPSHIILLGVTARVLQKIVGPRSWQLGTNAGADRFGSGLALAKDTLINGPADPPSTYWQEEDIVLTPTGGAFRGGRIAVAIHYIELPPPSMS